MLKFDSALQTSLAAATSKLDWCITLMNMLGTDLTVRCKRASDPASTTVFDTGTEFYNAKLVGGPVRSGGSIIGFGTIGAVTTELAADLTTGASVLRIEGNGHWIEGTLGLANSACDFKASGNPTTKTGFGFSTLSISGPRSLPSGTGAVAVALDANAPAFVELVDWSNPATPVSVGIIPLDTRAEDFVYQDAELAAEIGDVRVTQSSKTVIFGQFEFGATMMTINGALNLDAPGTPVHQIVVAHKPYGTWPTYPFADTFRPDRDTTFPKPYKIKIMRSDMTVLKTIEMRDGLPVNDPSLDQLFGPGYTKGLRPHMNCGQWHFWQSAKLKYSSNALKYFPGITDHFMRDTVAKNGASTNASVPLEVSRDQWNSTLHWYAAPEWPLPWGQETTQVPGETYGDDPYLYPIISYHGDEGHLSRLSGWNVEPGSISMHDWYCGPGGPRHDRGALHTPLIRYFTRPNGVRLKGNVPHRTLLDCYNHGYFHHAHHTFIADVKTLTTLPKEYMRDGLISYSHAYYGYSDYGYVPGGLARHVDLRAIANGGNWPAPVRDGHKGFWNGWEVDQHHSYLAPGLATIFCNSPAHTLSGNQRLFAHVCGQLGDAKPNTNIRVGFLSRVHAWRTLQLVVAWKIASAHPMGIDRETIEKRLQVELESVYDQVYKPAIIDNSTDMDLVAVRRFGNPGLVEYGNSQNGFTGLKWLRGVSDYKAGYFAGVLSLMRQTGCWNAMRQRSAKCATALRFIVDSMDKDSLASLYYTKGRYEKNFVYSDRVTSAGSAPADISAGNPDPVMYQDWVEWVAKNPPTGQETMIHNTDGTLNTSKLDAGTTMRMQWVFVRRDFFPDIPFPVDNNGNEMVTPTCNMVQGWMDALDTKIKGISSPFSAMSADMGYAWPPVAIYKAPATLGPL
jgi:hypothetical protein